MPFESSLLFVVANLSLAAIALIAWLKRQSRSWLAIAFITLSASVAAFTADRLVATDREQLQALFPRLTAAAERQDIDTTIEKANIEARKRGHSVSETQRQDGSIKVTVRVGGAA